MLSSLQQWQVCENMQDVTLGHCLARTMLINEAAARPLITIWLPSGKVCAQGAVPLEKLRLCNVATTPQLLEGRQCRVISHQQAIAQRKHEL